MHFPTTAALAAALVAAALSLEPPVELPAWQILITSTLIWVPFAYWLPRADVSLFGNVWRVPSTTLLLPRGIVCAIASSLWGLVLGAVVLGILDDGRYLLMAAWYAAPAIAMTISAARRMATAPATEFVLPLLPRWIMRECTRRPFDTNGN